MSREKERKAYLENQAKLRHVKLCQCGDVASIGDKCKGCTETYMREALKDAPPQYKAQPEPKKEGLSCFASN